MMQRLLSIDLCGQVLLMHGSCGDARRSALAIVAVALGLDFISGRVLATFYAQMGSASWLGIAVAGLAFGGIISGLARLQRRSGADRLAKLFLRLPGGGAGICTLGLYYLVLSLGMYWMISEAGHIAALVLPLRHAHILGSAFVLLVACIISVAGSSLLCVLGRGFVLLVILFEAALLLMGNLPAESRFYGALVLKLQDRWFIAMAFGLIHGAVCACLASGTVVKMAYISMCPRRLGMWSGGVFAAVLLLGNAVFMRADECLVALQIPFVALAGGWGAGGFYGSAALIFMGTLCSLAGIIYGFMPHPRMLNLIEK